MLVRWYSCTKSHRPCPWGSHPLPGAGTALLTQGPGMNTLAPFSMEMVWCPCRTFLSLLWGALDRPGDHSRPDCHAGNLCPGVRRGPSDYFLCTEWPSDSRDIVQRGLCSLPPPGRTHPGRETQAVPFSLDPTDMGSAPAQTSWAPWFCSPRPFLKGRGPWRWTQMHTQHWNTAAAFKAPIFL